MCTHNAQKQTMMCNPLPPPPQGVNGAPNVPKLLAE